MIHKTFLNVETQSNISIILTFSPEAQAPLRRGHLPVLVAVAGVEEGSDADLILVQVNSSQLRVVQIQITVGVQLREHPSDGVLAAGYKAPLQRCQKQFSSGLSFSSVYITVLCRNK